MPRVRKIEPYPVQEEKGPDADKPQPSIPPPDIKPIIPDKPPEQNNSNHNLPSQPPELNKQKKQHKKDNIGSKEEVYNGSKQCTSGGLKKEDLIMNKNGKIVSKKKHEAGLNNFKKNQASQ